MKTDKNIKLVSKSDLVGTVQCVVIKKLHPAFNSLVDVKEVDKIKEKVLITCDQMRARYSTMAQWVECSPLRRETRVQFPAGSSCSSVGQATYVQPPRSTQPMVINE